MNVSCKYLKKLERNLFKGSNQSKLSSNFSTSGGDRTHTLLPELDFESSASTNSATEAKPMLNYKLIK